MSVVVSYRKKCPNCNHVYDYYITEADVEFPLLGCPVIVCENCSFVFTDYSYKEWIFLNYEQQLDYLAQANMKKPEEFIRLRPHKLYIQHLVFFIIFFPFLLITLIHGINAIGYFIWYHRYKKSYKYVKNNLDKIEKLDKFGEIRESIIRTKDVKYVDKIKEITQQTVSNSKLNNIFDNI